MRVAFVIAAASFAAAAGFSQQAQATDCDVDYTIQPGDTLVSIAELAYGSQSYQLIYSANAAKIKSLSDLPIGASITVPCIPGVPSMTPNEVALSMAMLTFEEDTESAPEAEATETEDAPADVAAAPEVEVQAEEEESVTAEAAVETAAEPTAPTEEPAPETVVATAAPATEPTITPVAGIDRLRLLTANGLAPFADKGLRKGGMATELAELALSKLGIQDTSRIVFIDDRDSHLQDLLIDGSFDLGFPWFRPACEEIEIILKDL